MGRFLVSALLAIALQVTVAQAPAVGTPHHEADFDAKRQAANELFLAHKVLEALPLYEDLCRQDPTIAVFAERHGSGLLARASTLSDAQQRAQVYGQALAEMKRAQALGDNSPYVQSILDAGTKSLIGATITGIPLSAGYTYHGKPDAQAVFQQAEAAFGHSDVASAVTLYRKANELDPAWYDPALYAGDCYFRLKDSSNAATFFAKAIAIDPDRETAYRYWGDALSQSGDANGAKAQYVKAFVAEPYGKPASLQLAQWAQKNGHQLMRPAINRPEFTTTNGVLNVDPKLEGAVEDGRSSWIVYQRYRVAHGALTLNQLIVAGGTDSNGVIHPNGYRHTIAEEHAALSAMLADVDARLKSGALVENNLDPSIRNLRVFEHAGVLDAWIALAAADAGIRSDYATYRAGHRKEIGDFVETYLIR